jgi:hypothetical protein
VHLEIKKERVGELTGLYSTLKIRYSHTMKYINTIDGVLTII